MVFVFSQKEGKIPLSLLRVIFAEVQTALVCPRYLLEWCAAHRNDE